MLPQTLLTLKPNESANLQIYHALRQSIVNCTLLPGEAISDKEISELFSVSRQPVRDAFIKLSGAGLIQVLPQRGTFVMKISPKRVLNGRFIREAVEVAVVAKAAEMITDEQLLVLTTNIEQQKLAAKRNDTAAFLALDEEFHTSISRCIDCVEAWELIEDIKAHMDRVRYLSLGEITSLQMLIAQHTAILTALRARDPKMAEEAMRSHLREINFSFGPIRDRNPDWFESE
ncbi:MAG TPA: GntR family transcriptional regulator [Rhodocyclaceae bacterium]|nr:GntR family transcriptional regulator [Rhodocyclaceae bacterium]